ncbi:complement factor H-related protein 5-like isoform X2 [Oscarella lobularis]|uniref:complement factor H-related protein 5-like isoform X2 n=1 Tax=Oscarella lobularis TaxID=121494 RepID=UPI0033142E67
MQPIYLFIGVALSLFSYSAVGRKEKYCPTPPPISNATRWYSCRNINGRIDCCGTRLCVRDAYVEYRCDEGFKFNEKRAKRRCKSWKGRKPECLPRGGYCKAPEGLTNSENRTFKTGEKFIMNCSKGFELPDNRTYASILCQENGKWNGTYEICSPIKCPLPPKEFDGAERLRVTKLSENGTAFYTCLGSEKEVMMKCSNGSWIGDPFDCQGDCFTDTLFNNSHDENVPVVVRSRRERVKSDRKVRLRCKIKKQKIVSGDRVAHCENGAWIVKEIPVCTYQRKDNNVSPVTC